MAIKRSCLRELVMLPCTFYYVQNALLQNPNSNKVIPRHTVYPSIYLDKMLVAIMDTEVLFTCILFVTAFESIRIIVAFFLAQPSAEAKKLEVEKYEVQAELSTIKSVQLEFVRHSLLTRKVIKAEKQLELIQSQYLPKVQRVRRYLRIIRVLMYIAMTAYFSYGGRTETVRIKPTVLWPLSWILSGSGDPLLLGIYPGFILIICGAAMRHSLRTILPLVFSASTLP